jgi:hypothetical protein
MAETSKSTTKEKAAKTKKESHKEQEKLLNGLVTSAAGLPLLTYSPSSLAGALIARPV